MYVVTLRDKETIRFKELVSECPRWIIREYKDRDVFRQSPKCLFIVGDGEDWMESWLDEVISALYMEGDCFSVSFISYNLFPNFFAQFLNFWFKCEVFTNFIFNVNKILL